jgi:hypothetical protein
MDDITEGGQSPRADTFINVRPTPLLACGLSGPMRNSLDVVVMDVEVRLTPCSDAARRP